MIVAEPTTLTGSIGVFGGKLVMKQTMAKLGITVNAVSRGKHAGIFSTFSKFSKSERETMQKLLDQIYLIFTTKAAKGRKMKRTELLKYAGGQVWTGRQAKKHGLVDKLGSLNDTIKLVLKRTGLKARPQIVRFPRPKSFFESLQKMSAAPMKSSPYAMLKWMRQIVQLSPQHAQQLRPLLSSPMPVLMWSPMPRILLR
jgi:protease-4